MARASRQESEATGRRVRAEAAKLFSERGYASVALEEVAEAASVTRGAVYHHFRSKKGLFEAVAADAQQWVADAVLHAAEAHSDAWEGLLAGCRAFLTASLSDSSRQILLIDAPAVLGWNSWRRQDAEASGAHLREAIAELADNGVIDIGSVAATAALLSGAMNEAALFIADSDDRHEALESVVVDLFRMLAGMRAG